MNLIMTLLCRNEEDIIASHLDFHLGQGIDFVIAMDNGSEDYTVDILREYEKAGRLLLLHQPEDDFNQGTWVSDMARLAKTKYAADWVINSDADEFWWPVVGDLKTVLSALPQREDVVVVPRFNFVAVTDEKGPFFRRMVTREIISLNSLGLPLPPKVCHRAYADVLVEQGNHAVSRPSHVMPISNTCPFEILHFPVRSYRQFELKIVKGGSAYERNKMLSKEVGQTWRELYSLHKRGELQAYYARQVYDLARLEAGIASRRLVVDRRIENFMNMNG